jgi:hypothetical protein
MIPDRKYPSLPATGINPASFPLGSMESRAAIRALLLRRSALSDDDLDALVLYAGAFYLDARMKPNYRELEATAAYQAAQSFAGCGLGQHSWPISITIWCAAQSPVWNLRL